MLKKECSVFLLDIYANSAKIFSTAVKINIEKCKNKKIVKLIKMCAVYDSVVKDFQSNLINFVNVSEISLVG